jgi:hypothetical protein
MRVMFANLFLLDFVYEELSYIIDEFARRALLFNGILPVYIY